MGTDCVRDLIKTSSGDEVERRQHDESAWKHGHAKVVQFGFIEFPEEIRQVDKLDEDRHHARARKTVANL